MAAITYGGATIEERRAALESRMSASWVRDLFDDDNDGVLEGTDLATLEQVLGDADDVVTGVLLNKGYSAAQIEILKADRQIVRLWANIAAQLAGERKPHLFEDGVGPWDVIGQRARTELGRLARGDIRSHLESEAGVNTTLSGQVDVRENFYAPDPNDPNDRGPGGF